MKKRSVLRTLLAISFVISRLAAAEPADKYPLIGEGTTVASAAVIPDLPPDQQISLLKATLAKERADAAIHQYLNDVQAEIIDNLPPYKALKASAQSTTQNLQKAVADASAAAAKLCDGCVLDTRTYKITKPGVAPVPPAAPPPATVTPSQAPPDHQHSNSAKEK